MVSCWKRIGASSVLLVAAATPGLGVRQAVNPPGGDIFKVGQPPAWLSRSAAEPVLPPHGLGRAADMAEEGGDSLAAINDQIRASGKAAEGGAWLPLESNPEVLGAFARRIGLPEAWTFVDVLGLDSELLGLVQGPVAALILLFPCTERIFAARAAQDAALRAGRGAATEELFFMRQVPNFGNACGTIACLHALTNSRHILQMAGDAPLEAFVRSNLDAAPEARGQALLTAEALKAPSDDAAVDTSAQTPCPHRDGPPLDHHFVAFVRTPEGRLVELDGTKRCPVDHGATTAETFLEDAAAAVRASYVAADPDVHGFALMALAAAG